MKFFILILSTVSSLAGFYVALLMLDGLIEIIFEKIKDKIKQVYEAKKGRSKKS